VRRLVSSLAVLFVGLFLGSAALLSQTRAGSGAVVYEGARLIIGDQRAPIENGAFLVQNGRITAVGRRGAIPVPAGASHVDLAGKTVMPGMINVHVHIGYEGYTSWGAEDYTPANIVDHLQREAFYGVVATQTVGSSPTDASIEFIKDQEAGKFPPASRFFFMPGMAPPNGGPDATLKKGTDALHAVYEVSTPAEARADVQSMAAKQLKNVKIWVDDRRGTYPKMTPDVYNAVIDEAHKHGMLVQAHAIVLPDQKAVVSAGVDVLVHTVQNEKLDDEFLAMLRAHKPYWTTVIGLGDRSEICENDPFIDQSYPARVLATLRQTGCGAPNANNANREAILANNVPLYVKNGARLMLGTDAGISPRYSFGWADHHEMLRWVTSGISPADAIVAATSRPAEYLGLKDLGTLAPGKSADFIVLDANPLDDIRNTRQIDSVYMRGAKLDREALAAGFKKGDK
jgi:imidazolonepropionase-like amidohydrolase